MHIGEIRNCVEVFRSSSDTPVLGRWWNWNNFIVETVPPRKHWGRKYLVVAEATLGQFPTQNVRIYSDLHLWRNTPIDTGLYKDASATKTKLPAIISTLLFVPNYAFKRVRPATGFKYKP